MRAALLPDTSSLHPQASLCRVWVKTKSHDSQSGVEEQEWGAGPSPAPPRVWTLETPPASPPHARPAVAAGPRPHLSALSDAHRAPSLSATVLLARML